MQYTPFGDVTAATGVLAPFGFTGAAQDAASSLTYLRARFYHPALGRFLTPDSLVPDPLNGQAWNAYAYVYNDPINLVDPSGYDPEPPPDFPDPLTYIEQQLRAEWAGAAQAAQNIPGNVAQWWNQAPCNCSTDGVSPNATSAYNGLGVTATVAIGLSTNPVEATKTIVVQQRRRYLGILPGEWQEIGRTSGSHSAMADYRIPELDGQGTVRRGTGFFKQVETRMRSFKGVSRVRGINGLTGGLVVGGLFDAVIQMVQDMGRCISGGDWFHNGGVAFAASLMAGLVGVAFYGAIALAFPAAVGTATFVAIGTTWFAGNYGSIADWKVRNRR